MDVPWRTLTLMLRYSSTAVVLVGPDGQVRWASRSARRIFAGIRMRGATFADLFEDPVAADLFLQASARNEPGYSTGWRTMHRHPDGWVGEVFAEATLLPASQATGTLVTIYAPPPEISETDALTGCGNRRGAERALAALHGEGYLARLDMNRFKELNDKHGHHVGDKVLMTVADRLQRAVGDHGTVFRMGGDEFDVVFASTDVSRVEDVLGQALWELEEPIEVEPGFEVTCSATAGITSLESLHPVRAGHVADGALYYAKRHGRPYIVASRDMPQWAQDRGVLLATAESLEVERDAQAKLARTDPLTGLANRLSLDEDSRRLAARAQRSAQPFSVLFVDLDYFSEYNKHHGDSAGDKALVAVGEVMRSQCRTEDVVYRKGGEEFVLLLPDTTLDEAAAIAERLRVAIADAALPHLARGDDLDMLTAVVGVAQSSPDDASPEHTWERASAPIMNLKKNRRAARNRVLLADPAPVADSAGQEDRDHP